MTETSCSREQDISRMPFTWCQGLTDSIYVAKDQGHGCLTMYVHVFLECDLNISLREFFKLCTNVPLESKMN